MKMVQIVYFKEIVKGPAILMIILLPIKKLQKFLMGIFQIAVKMLMEIGDMLYLAV